MRHSLPAALLCLIAALPAARAAPLKVLAAENFYGDVAAQIGGTEVAVTSILSNPDQDPHLFEVSPSVGRAVAAARIVIYSGLGYDSWMARLLGAAPAAGRTAIVVADLAGRRAGDNPHIWYDPETMARLARAVAAALAGGDPAHRAEYQERLARFEASLAPVRAKIAEMRKRLAGTPVTATEPVFGYMFAALGMPVRNRAFQLAVMNDTEPSASSVAAFETDLRTHRVKLLAYNSQATDPIAERMRQIAAAAGVPVVGVTETEPAGTDYQAWIKGALAAVDRALSGPTR